MDINQRDAHLKQFFTEEILDGLDQTQRTVLYEEYANSELRLLAGQSLETIQQSADRKSTAELERRMTYIQAEEYPLLKEWYLGIAKSVHEIVCSKCKALLGIEVDTLDEATNSHHLEGKFVISVGDNMYAYRPRLDGLMGYQCANYVKGASFKAWQQYEKDTADYNAAYIEATNKYNTELEEWNSLDRDTQAEILQPVLVFEETAPVEPEEPAMVPCGNDTRWAQIEIDNIDETHIMTSLTKEDIVKVKQEMNASDYKPDTKKTKKGYTAESFELREVK